MSNNTSPVCGTGRQSHATGNHRVEGRDYGSDAIYRGHAGNPEGRTSGPGGDDHTDGGTDAIAVRGHRAKYDADRLSSR